MKHHVIVLQERLRLAEIISVLRQRLRILADNPHVALCVGVAHAYREIREHELDLHS
jgi:hypothetical protein